jgi:hypothetical protein
MLHETVHVRMYVDMLDYNTSTRGAHLRMNQFTPLRKFAFLSFQKQILQLIKIVGKKPLEATMILCYIALCIT